MTLQDKINKLLEEANRYELAVSSDASPSSQEWISQERVDHYRKMANDKRKEAKKLGWKE